MPPVQTILIVDDDPDIRFALHLRLKAQYHTAFAGNAIAAITAASNHRPDLIILDLGLPGEDGYAVLATLHSTPHLASIPVIVLSGRDHATNRKRATEAGAWAYLTKPPETAELMATIHKALGY